MPIEDYPHALGHVVSDVMIGNTRCIICDDYCRNNTREDNERIMNEVFRKAQIAITDAYYAKLEKEGKI